MANVPLAEVSPRESWVYEFDLKQRNATTRLPEALTPVTTAKAWWSATEDGNTIHTDLEKTLTEASGKLGTVYAECPQSAMMAHLTVYIGKTIWEVFELPSKRRVSRPYKCVKIQSI